VSERVIGINLSAFPPQEPEPLLAGIAAAGIQVVEVHVSEEWVQPQDPSRQLALARLFARHGLRPASIHTPFGKEVDLGARDEQLRKAGVKAVADAARALWEMGGSLAVVHPGRPCPPEHRMQAARACRRSLEDLLEATASCPVTLLVENMLPDHACSSSCELATAMDGLPERVRFCLDTGHAALTPEGLAVAHVMAGRLGWVHLQDNLGEGDDHLRPWSGKLDWHLVARLLDEGGYTGPYLFELKAGPNGGNLKELHDLAARLEGLRGSQAEGQEQLPPQGSIRNLE